MWECVRARTPAAIRTGYDLIKREQMPSTPHVRAQCPREPARDHSGWGDEGSAFSDWLAHLAAGRIAVR